MALATYKWSVSVIDSLTYTLFIEQLGSLSWTNELKSAKHIYVPCFHWLKKEKSQVCNRGCIDNNMEQVLFLELREVGTLFNPDKQVGISSAQGRTWPNLALGPMIT